MELATFILAVFNTLLLLIVFAAEASTFTQVDRLRKHFDGLRQWVIDNGSKVHTPD
jgi:hypothetical protein